MLPTRHCRNAQQADYLIKTKAFFKKIEGKDEIFPRCLADYLALNNVQEINSKINDVFSIIMRNLERCYADYTSDIECDMAMHATRGQSNGRMEYYKLFNLRSGLDLETLHRSLPIQDYITVFKSFNLILYPDKLFHVIALILCHFG